MGREKSRKDTKAFCLVSITPQESPSDHLMRSFERSGVYPRLRRFVSVLAGIQPDGRRRDAVRPNALALRNIGEVTPKLREALGFFYIRYWAACSAPKSFRA